jgi:hypothetical protein
MIVRANKKAVVCYIGLSFNVIHRFGRKPWCPWKAGISDNVVPAR